jgi:carboxylesterase type B
MNQTECIQGGPLMGSTSCPLKPFGTQTEDCLFLDIYVPQWVLGTSTALPVVSWIYGGGYFAGSKNNFDPTVMPLYDGNGPINTASTAYSDKNSVIFVVG